MVLHHQWGSSLHQYYVEYSAYVEGNVCEGKDAQGAQLFGMESE